mmetsp:Transcript_3437/g.8596  ORF Transcript_3437/g.8596 Transcript_3437/m.8596 type:complete len:202 (+) Transcript_3437:192-797(+)
MGWAAGVIMPAVHANAAARSILRVSPEIHLSPSGCLSQHTLSHHTCPLAPHRSAARARGCATPSRCASSFSSRAGVRARPPSAPQPPRLAASSPLARKSSGLGSPALPPQARRCTEEGQRQLRTAPANRLRVDEAGGGPGAHSKPQPQPGGRRTALRAARLGKGKEGKAPSPCRQGEYFPRPRNPSLTHLDRRGSRVLGHA